ncbi:GntR family transcriptional regulator [Marinomonas sp. SBI22]|uniref:MocR-like pyridoxine biosynthesis transcription factor PdxR n=1 Tax=unclassified Marinomonas TaxID=196814 RepID=UPI0007AFA7DD|nr:MULTISPECIES: PLP-dependent aminotransferase family protein [unclassified Marinomonas]KZM41071.1 GntR family transcriptional regulator [Marinomonas sp. SBI22]KZM42911.1 GntR family transcriptional regulator [Marinomonas sp. SBI8L]
MLKHYFHIEFDPERTLQDQIREYLVDLVLTGSFPLDKPLPSSRNLAHMLGVSRNTIVLIYESLVDSGYIEAKSRKGFFITANYDSPETIGTNIVQHQKKVCPNWTHRFQKQPSNERNIVKPNDWQGFEYPFIYGQIQREFFPLEQWRDSVRKSMSGQWNKYWINDMVDTDDPLLIEQIRTRLLPRRGIYVEPSEIIITIGTQNSLYLLANLLCSDKTQVTMENPGFRDALNIFSLFDSKIQKQNVDHNGIIVDDKLNSSDYLYVTPSTQVPTGVELSEDRRKALLEKSVKHDFVIIEDDYDAEINMKENPQPALKALDQNNRVIYIGSMSKSISPGLRIGYMVADEELISEVRALRRLMYRHPPVNIQRQLSLFLSLGYYDTYLRKLRVINSSKLNRMRDAVSQYLPHMYTVKNVSEGATSLWLEASPEVNTEEVAWLAARNSILIEPGAVHFINEEPPKNFFRLGFSAIENHKIEPGIHALKTVFEHF